MAMNAYYRHGCSCIIETSNRHCWIVHNLVSSFKTLQEVEYEFGTV